ncbi:MAG: hypothetical protein AB7G39_14620 [Alphaproteobacteria bacterium]
MTDRRLPSSAMRGHQNRPARPARSPEPTLREIFDEPIVRMLMRSDRVSEADVVTALRGDPVLRRREF